MGRCSYVNSKGLQGSMTGHRPYSGTLGVHEWKDNNVVCRWVPPTMMVADGSHQTAAQRGGEAKDKDKPLPDLQRDR